MKYFCHSCETIQDYLVEKKDYFDHAYGKKICKTYHCPSCQSEQWEEIREHGYLLKTSKTTKIIYEDDDLIDWIHTLGKCEVEEF